MFDHARHRQAYRFEASSAWRTEPLALGLMRLCTAGRLRNEPGSYGSNTLLFAMRTDTLAL